MSNPLLSNIGVVHQFTEYADTVDRWWCQLCGQNRDHPDHVTNTPSQDTLPDVLNDDLGTLMRLYNHLQESEAAMVNAANVHKHRTAEFTRAAMIFAEKHKIGRYSNA